MYKHVHTVVQTVGISRNLSESVGSRAQVAVAEECLWLLSQSIYNIRYTEAGVAVSRCAPFGSLWISVDLLWFFLWTPRPHAWTISFNCRKLSSQLRLGPSIDIDMKKNTVKNTRIKGVFEANLFLHTRSQRVKEHWVLPSG